VHVLLAAAAALDEFAVDVEAQVFVHDSLLRERRNQAGSPW